MRFFLSCLFYVTGALPAVIMSTDFKNYEHDSFFDSELKMCFASTHVHITHMTSLQRLLSVTLLLCSYGSTTAVVHNSYTYAKTAKQCVCTLFFQDSELFLTQNYDTVTVKHQSSLKVQKYESSNLPASLWVLWYRLAQTFQGGPDEQKKMRIRGMEEENGKRKRKIKQRFVLTEHRAPWLLTLGEAA